MSSARSIWPRARRRTPAYRALNPQGFVPMLEIDGHRLTQSLAICNYLEPASSPSRRSCRADAGRRRACAGAGAGGRLRHPPAQQPARAQISEGRARRVARKPRTNGTATGSPKGWPRWRRWPSRAPARSCSATRRRVADICLVPQLYNARRFSVPLDRLSDACAAPTRRPARTRPSPPPTPTDRSNDDEPRRQHQPRHGRGPAPLAEVEIPSLKGKVSDEEWAIRVDLAAAYRLVAHYGWDDLIFTHLSARIPGPEHHFLLNPYQLMFEEVTASSLVKVDVHGNPVEPTWRTAPTPPARWPRWWTASLPASGFDLTFTRSPPAGDPRPVHGRAVRPRLDAQLGRRGDDPGRRRRGRPVRRRRGGSSPCQADGSYRGRPATPAR